MKRQNISKDIIKQEFQKYYEINKKSPTMDTWSGPFNSRTIVRYFDNSWCEALKYAGIPQNTREKEVLEQTCKNCDSLFTKKYYQKCCSRLCSVQYRTKQNNKLLQKYCLYCNKLLTFKRKYNFDKTNYCSNFCFNQTRRDKETIKDCISGQKHTGGANRYNAIRGRARFLYKKIGECQICGYNHHIEICHIKAIKSFPLDTLVKEVNNPNNIAILCPNHHWEADNNIISIKSIIEYPDLLKRIETLQLLNGS